MAPPPSSSFHGFQHQHRSKHLIKGPRPSPLMIKTISHSIRKASSSSTTMAPQAPPPYQQQQIRKPVIIYTHSPKIIHTKPEKFMAVVQKLTGKPRPNKDTDDAVLSGAGTIDNPESSLSDESIISNIKQEKISDSDFNNEITSSSSSLLNRYTNHHEAADVMNYGDIPLFTPNSSDFFISPCSRSVFKQSPDSPFGILDSLISPSALEFIKELPEY